MTHSAEEWGFLTSMISPYKSAKCLLMIVWDLILELCTVTLTYRLSRILNLQIQVHAFLQEQETFINESPFQRITYKLEICPSVQQNSAHMLHSDWHSLSVRLSLFPVTCYILQLVHCARWSFPSSPQSHKPRSYLPWQQLPSFTLLVNQWPRADLMPPALLIAPKIPMPSHDPCYTSRNSHHCHKGKNISFDTKDYHYLWPHRPNNYGRAQ